MVVVYNARDTKSTVNLRIPHTSADNVTKALALDPIVLAPGEVRELSLEVQDQTSKLLCFANASSAFMARNLRGGFRRAREGEGISTFPKGDTIGGV
jgi:hypothetical protein